MSELGVLDAWRVTGIKLRTAAIDGLTNSGSAADSAFAVDGDHIERPFLT